MVNNPNRLPTKLYVSMDIHKESLKLNSPAPKTRQFVLRLPSQAFLAEF